MISPTKLRIGNYFEYGKSNSIDQVYTIDLDIGNGYLINKIPVDNIRPIPLTPEWLERFGFVYTPGGGYDLGHKWTIEYMPVLVKHEFSIEMIDYNTALWLEGNNAHVLIHTVHKLQNLFFALSGTELEVKK